MNNDDSKKQVDVALNTRSVAINEGAFMIRINKSEVDKSDFAKQCLYGDAFRSAYSPNLMMIPTSVFLPQMFVGKNVFMEQKLGHSKVPMLDSFLPFAFLLTRDDHATRIFDDFYGMKDEKSYSEIYGEMKRSVIHHMQGTKRNVNFPNETEMLSDSSDPETDAYLERNDDVYSVIFFTQASSVRIQKSRFRELQFGVGGTNHVVPLSNNQLAIFDGLSNGCGIHESNVKLSPAVTRALMRELLTFTQLFLGYEKRPSDNVGNYVRNMNHLFNGQFKSIETDNDENIESYSLAALKLYVSRNIETDETTRQSPILADDNYKETIQKKVLFQLIMLLDMGSCFNARRLSKKEVTDGKATVVCTEQYTNPFTELVGALYENVGWLSNLFTSCMFFARVKNRSCCESCQQKVCAINAPSLMFVHSTNRSTAKKERTGAVACFYTSTAFNRTGPLGNLKHIRPNASADADNVSSIVMWEKQHGELLKSLLDSYQLDLNACTGIEVSRTKTNEENIDEMAERCMDHVCTLLDNAVGTCEEYCRELEEDADSVSKVNSVESEIRNVYRISQLYDKGITNVLLSESLLYLLRCMLLLEQSSFSHQSVNDVFLKIRPLLLDNKSGFTISCIHNQKTTALPKIAVKSYSSDGMTVDVDSQISENYNFEELLFHVSFKSKTYLYGRFDEKRNNGSRKIVQNFANRKLGSSTALTAAATNNSFLHFKNFCSKKACEALGIQNDAYCLDVLNNTRDERLDKYAPLFRYVMQYRVDNWPAVMQLVSAMKLLEYLNFTPSYDRMSMLSFNRLNRNSFNKYHFEQSMLCDTFNNFETVYAQNCNLIEFSTEIQGKRLVFKKCSGKSLDCFNELLNNFSNTKMHPGSPIFYMAFGEKTGRFKETTTNSVLDNFLNVEQYKLEKDAAFTHYIRKNRKQLYDDVFSATFSNQSSNIDNKYTPEILEEMMSEFDELFQPALFASEQIRGFLKFVLGEYLNPDQSKVGIMAKRINEINARAVNRSRKRRRSYHDEVYVEPVGGAVTENDADDEYASFKKCRKH